MSGASSQVRRLSRRTWLLLALLLGTGGVYLVNLTGNGWSNAFYAAAAQAGSQSWEAFLFGASDAPGTITVDKPPLSLWPMALSIKLFGLSSASLLVPQVLLGVASVGLLYLVVRRSFSADAGLIAGLVFAVTPIVMVMFRHDNPDGMLVFLEIAATGAMLEAVRAPATAVWRRGGSGWWLLLSGVLVGFAFLTKQLAAFLIVPGLALVWLVSAKPKLLKRIGLSVVALAGLVVSAGWWVALVELWSPKDTRPWVGGSDVNSFLDLTFGYNGIGRLTGAAFQKFGAEKAGECSPEGFKLLDFAPGPGRMFSEMIAGQIGWFLPAAVVFLVFGAAVVWRLPRTDARKAGLLAWGGWFVVTLVVFSYMKDTFHPYYSVALAPAIAALVGAGLVLAWERRGSYGARFVLSAATLATGVTAWAILQYTPNWLPWLSWSLLVVATLVSVGFLLVPDQARAWHVLALGVAVVGLCGPVAYAFPTLSRSIGGGMPEAGPHDFFRDLIADLREQPESQGEGCGRNMFGEDRPSWDDKPDPALVAALREDGGKYTWTAAGIGSMGAAAYQLDSGFPVMPVGGFGGRDPWPTFERFQQLVAEHKIHYFIDEVDTDPEDDDDDSESAKITKWVEGRFPSQTFGEMKLYDLTKPNNAP